MKISEYKVKPKWWNDLKGKIYIDAWYSYEICGPFGQGYKIKLSRRGANAELNYHWREDPFAFANTPDGKYQIAPQDIFFGDKNVLKMSGSGEFEPLNDDLAMGLYTLNHLFYKKEWPFVRKNA